MSSVGQFFVESYGVRMRGGYLRFQAQYLRRIRVPIRKPYLVSTVGSTDRSLSLPGSTARDTSCPWVYGIDERRWRQRLDIEKRLQDAVQSYWDARAKNKEKQVQSGKIDAGTRGEVTGGTQMGALEVLVADILCDCRAETARCSHAHLPGACLDIFRATKKWDLIVVSEGSIGAGDGIQVPGGQIDRQQREQSVRGGGGKCKGHLDGIPRGPLREFPYIPFLGYFFLLRIAIT